MNKGFICVWMYVLVLFQKCVVALLCGCAIYISHSTVVRDCHGWSSIMAIHKEISVSISICLLRTSRWRTCKKRNENITPGMKYR